MIIIEFPSILTTIAEHARGDLDITPLDPRNVAMPDTFIMSSRGDCWSVGWMA
jgi:hypothetical protein